MIRRKSAYYYDSETCTYTKVKFSWKTFFSRVGVFIAIAVTTTLLTHAVYPTFFEDDQSVRLKVEQSELESQMGVLSSKLDHYESEVNDLLARDNGMYLPIMGEKQISRNAWLAPRGGSAENNQETAQVRDMWDRIEKLHIRMKLLSTSLGDVIGIADRKEMEIRNIPSILPANAIMISGFGNRVHPVSGRVKHHSGVDFACQTGTPIYASGNARVASADYNANGYGNCINLDHGNGYQSKYAHLSKVEVTEGQLVTRGELIGYSGNTGLSTGPHLHYEISLDGVKIDPIDFFYEDLSPHRYLKLVQQAEGKAVDDVSVEDIKEALKANAPMD